MVNNLNDGLIWGLIPLFLHAKGFGIGEIAMVSAAYPVSWAGLQIFTGGSATGGRNGLIVSCMVLQSGAIAAFLIAGGLELAPGAAVLLGVGTTMVSPTLLAAAADVAPPSSRAAVVGV